MTFPFGPDGLLVPAVLGLTAADMGAARASGLASPGLHQVRAMIDTGATKTSVAPGVLARLNVPPEPAVQTTTAAGSVQVHLYQVSFTIYDLTSGVTLTRPDWTVTNLLHDLDDVDVLIGLDLLREIVLTVNGPGQAFSLDF
jgi:gag-polyprotein putative aspartyl protease